jgi:hypothetical protein
MNAETNSQISGVIRKVVEARSKLEVLRTMQASDLSRVESSKIVVVESLLTSALTKLKEI